MRLPCIYVDMGADLQCMQVFALVLDLLDLY